MFKNLKIRTKITLTSLVFIGLISSFFFINTRTNNLKNVQEKIKLELNCAQDTFNILKQNDLNMLASTLQAIVTNNDLKKLYLSQNRDQLYQTALPLFKELKTNYGITHWYFISPDGKTFLRLHNPDFYDDQITRTSFQKAKDNQTLGTELELGKTAYALRAVMPYYHQGELIGYVELGEEIDHFLKVLKQNTNSDFAIVVDKQNIDQAKWSSVRKITGLRNNWDDLKDYLVINATTDTGVATQCFTQTQYQKLLAGENIFKTIKQNNFHLQCTGFNITDSQNQPIGGLLMSLNISDYLQEINQNQTTTAVLSLIFALTASLITIFASQIITKPIIELSKTAQLISKGDLTKKVSVNSKDEIGILADSFNQMTDKLQQLYQDLEKTINDLKLKVQESEKINKLMVGRELKMVQLKKQLKNSKLKNEN